MELFRLKLILEDGRKIYTSKRGKIDIVSKEQVDSLKAVFQNGAYTQDLTMFSSYDLLKAAGKACVRVTGLELEPETSSIDTDAFIAGGIKASDAT